MISTISHVKNIDLRYVLQSHDNRAVLSTSLVSIDTSFPTQNILSYHYIVFQPVIPAPLAQVINHDLPPLLARQSGSSTSLVTFGGLVLFPRLQNRLSNKQR